VIDRKPYTPGPASGAQVQKNGENWTLILVRTAPLAGKSLAGVNRPRASARMDGHWPLPFRAHGKASGGAGARCKQ